MIKENLYCIPFEKRVLRKSKGIAYHCERNEIKSDKTVTSKSKSASRPTSASVPKPSMDENKNMKCNQCGKSFKSIRGLNIHRTKQNHHEKSSKNTKNLSPVLIKQNSKPKRKRNRTHTISPYENVNKALKN